MGWPPRRPMVLRYVIRLGFIIELCIFIRSFELPRYYANPGLPTSHRARKVKGVGEPRTQLRGKCVLESSAEGGGVSFSSVEAYEKDMDCQVSAK